MGKVNVRFCGIGWWMLFFVGGDGQKLNNALKISSTHTQTTYLAVFFRWKFYELILLMLNCSTKISNEQIFEILLVF